MNAGRAPLGPADMQAAGTELDLVPLQESRKFSEFF